MKNNLSIAINAAIKAGEVIMNVYESDFDVEMKSDNSPLTIADEKANDIINSYLIPTKISIISEENKEVDYAIRKNWKTVWIVDPLDGTKEFIKRNGEFTVNIALVQDGKPVLGVIFVPVSKALYFADVQNEVSKKIVLESFKDLSIQDLESAELIQPLKKDNVIRVVGSRSHMNDDTKTYLEKLKIKSKEVQIVSKGSSLKFCLVAEGAADIYPRFAPTMEWDTAAGQAICEAVGVRVISQETNKELLYNKENLLNPWFMVSK